jgi:hypothetical protein
MWKLVGKDMKVEGGSIRDVKGKRGGILEGSRGVIKSVIMKPVTLYNEYMLIFESSFIVMTP